AQKLFGLNEAIKLFGGENQLKGNENTEGASAELQALLNKFEEVKKDLDPHNWDIIKNWESVVKKYKDEVYSFTVRDKKIEIKTHTESLSHTQVPKVSLPRY